jgi:hypothetical protein
MKGKAEKRGSGSAAEHDERRSRLEDRDEFASLDQDASHDGSNAENDAYDAGAVHYSA